MKLALTQFDIKLSSQDKDFFLRIDHLAQSAHKHGAELFVLPEYFSLSSIFLDAPTLDCELTLLVKKRLKFSEILQQHMQEIAQKYKLVIVSGTMPHFSMNGKLVNRCFTYFPNGSMIWQDKLHMTRWENEHWKVEHGEPIVPIYEVGGLRCANLICYDIEFPSFVKQLAEASVELIIVPSYTEKPHGYWRVRNCAQARAVELQCYVGISGCLGENSRADEPDTAYTQAACFSPCDLDFPEDGILAASAQISHLPLTTDDGEMLKIFDLDGNKIRHVRKNGTVFNFRDQLADNIRIKTPLS